VEKIVTGLVDTGLEFYRQVLDLRAYRQQILTADIANASTPGFKAVDLDFREALGAATSPLQASDTPPAPLWPAADPPPVSLSGDSPARRAAASVKYQTDTPVTLDGNSVDLNREKTAAAENAVQYEAAAGFAAQIIRMLATAISGPAGTQSGGG
jgi:flagellar basal-body rod protein FlgB